MSQKGARKFKAFWKVLKYLTLAAIVLAAADTVILYNQSSGSSGTFKLFRQNYGALQYLSAVGLIMTSGLMLMVGRRSLGGIFFLLGIVLAIKAGFSLSE